jgi:hypothetical protein
LYQPLSKNIGQYFFEQQQSSIEQEALFGIIFQSVAPLHVTRPKGATLWQTIKYYKGLLCITLVQ